MQSSKTLLALVAFLVLAAVPGLSMTEQRPISPPSATLMGYRPLNEPLILSSDGDTTWLQVHTNSGTCPGDPAQGHGGEATGGPGPLETWCFENGPGDSCGTYPPWNTNCFDHVDVKMLPSNTGVNYWHLDAYRTDQRSYCGDYALWCGSSSVWDGQPVECGTWQNPPGYGNVWNCYVQLEVVGLSVANGCTLFFDPRYDLECKYDYFYVDYWNGTTWKTMAAFNATSSNAGPVCGGASAPNPDYWGNTDVDRLTNCDWQDRAAPDEPAFKRVITHTDLVITASPKFRWRVVADASVSDADGRIDTDGAAFLDNVWVHGDVERFHEDFETGSLNPLYWSLPDPAGVIDQWHISHDPDPPYEGGDGGDRTGCLNDSSFMYRARPEYGYPAGAAWRNSWHYRLTSPTVPIQNSGCVVQYDEYRCFLDYTCDYGNTFVRFYDSGYDRWCPWVITSGFYFPGGCFFFNYDLNQDVSSFYGETADSMQFAWEVVDLSVPMPPSSCRGKHASSEFMVDNVSIGFFNAHATEFSARAIDLLHDTFFTGICAYNSFFDAYDPDSVNRYSGPSADPLPATRQLYLDILDRDEVAYVDIWGSIDKGTSWVSAPMTQFRPHDPDHPTLGGEYYGTLCPEDFGDSAWVAGTEVWYYVKATDSLGNFGYFPDNADPSSPQHTGDAKSYYEFSILPLYPQEYTGPRVLLVDGHGRATYDYSPCVSRLDYKPPLEDIYEKTLTDAGYCYDKYDIEGAGSYVHIHPTWFSDYDAVVWFTGPYFSDNLFDKEAQEAIRDYLGVGGKVVLCGDRIAYNMSPTQVGADSLAGEFLGGIMGATYVEEMPSPLDYPYVYAVAVDSVLVFGSPVAVDLDAIAIYRECPFPKDMSYVLENASPPAGYTAQQLMYILNPTLAAADEVIYTEYQGLGQCAYVNFDLSASANHVHGYCSGNAQDPAPDFTSGYYDGRVELMRVILEDIFGLPSGGGGPADVVEPKAPVYRWSLGQNTPNPCVSTTEIRYEIAKGCPVRLSVYDARGRLVRELLRADVEAGNHSVVWDGRDTRGERLSSGVYFYIIEAGGYRATKKMLVVN